MILENVYHKKNEQFITQAIENHPIFVFTIHIQNGIIRMTQKYKSSNERSPQS